MKLPCGCTPGGARCTVADTLFWASVVAAYRYYAATCTNGDFTLSQEKWEEYMTTRAVFDAHFTLKEEPQ